MSTKENDSDSKKSEVNFDNFQKFKEYKKKMRDKGLDSANFIVSIPNLDGESYYSRYFCCCNSLKPYVIV